VPDRLPDDVGEYPWDVALVGLVELLFDSSSICCGEDLIEPDALIRDRCGACADECRERSWSESDTDND